MVLQRSKSYTRPSYRSSEPPEYSMDFMFNLNNIIKVKNKSVQSKFLKWREMTIYNVSQELKEAFKELQEVETELESMFSKQMGNTHQFSKEMRNLDVDSMFEPFEALIEQDSEMQ